MNESREKRPFVYFVALQAIRWWANLYLRLKCYGRHHIPGGGGCLVVANHASYLDPPLLGVGVAPHIAHFLARSSLFEKNALFTWFLHRVRVVPLNRGHGDVAALRKGLRILRRGGLLALFPEGTRSPDGSLLPAEAGVGFLIAKARVPVVPAYIDGAHRALPPGSSWIRPRRVRIYFGPPIDLSHIASFGSGREGYQHIADEVMRRIAALAPPA